MKFNKGIVIVSSIVITTILVFVGILLYISNSKNTEIVKAEATVVLLGDSYIVVEDNEGIEYSIDTTDDYNLGDRVSFVMENIDKKSKIREGKVTKLDTISKSVNFTINDSKEDTKPNINSGPINEGNSSANKNADNDITLSNTNVTEDDVVSYVDELNNRITSYNGDKTIGESLKSGFVTVIDFLFYKGTIKGKTFNELSTTAKLKVLKLVFSIDKGIDKHFPGYKESISSTSKKVYTSVKSKAMEQYLNITTEVCTKDPYTCTFAKEGLSDLKSSFSLTWNFIKDISGVGVSKLKAWYEVWRET